MKGHRWLLGFLILLILSNCAGNRKTTVFVPVTKEELPLVPAGVDTSLAMKARERARNLFSTPEAIQEADTIFKDVQDYVKIVEELYQRIKTKKDTLKILRSKYFNLKEELKAKRDRLLQDRKKLQLIATKMQKDSATIDIVFSLLEYFLFDARSKLEHAYSIDPTNLDILLLSGKSENNRGQMYDDKSAYYSALKFFFNYLEHDKGFYDVYGAIASSYFQLNEWKKSYEYARKAKEIYAITSYFDRPLKERPAKYANTSLPRYADPERYFDLLYIKGFTEIRSYQPDSAFVTLNEALLFAPTEKKRKNVISLIKTYIDWDGKNIRTAEMHLEINDSLNARNFKWAHRALWDLIPKLRTPKARHQVVYEIAYIENNYFENPEKAVERLYPVIVELDSNKETTSFLESPADTIEQKYFMECGQMLLNLGRKYRNEGDWKKANKYLAQDTTIDWKGRAKAFLLIRPEISENLDPRTRMITFNKKRLKLLFRAYALKENLDPKEVDVMYRDIIDIYRSLGDQRNMRRYFFEWQQYKSRKQTN